MSEQEAQWLIAGLFVLVAVLYVMALNLIPFMQRRMVKKVVEKTACEENRDFLIQNANYQDYASKNWYWGILLTVFALVTIFGFEEVYLESGAGEMSFLSIVHTIALAGVMIAHLIAGAVSALWLICTTPEEFRNSVYVKDFLSDQESGLLRVVNAKMEEREEQTAEDDKEFEVNEEGDYRQEYEMRSWRVYMPDELVSVMKVKSKLAEYHKLALQLRDMKEVDPSLLTPEQVERNGHFERQFHESLTSLEPLLSLVNLATDLEHYKEVEKEKLDKKKIRNDFDQKQTEAERALMMLNEAVQFNESQPVLTKSVPEAIRELQRVAESELVSPELKEEASALIGRIEQKQIHMRNQEVKELVDLDAITVIRASTLFYGLDDPTADRALVLPHSNGIG